MHSKVAKRIMEKEIEEKKFTRTDLYNFAEHMMITFASKVGASGMMQIKGEDHYRIKMLLIDHKRHVQELQDAEKLKEKEERVKKILIELDELKERQIKLDQQIHVIRNAF